MKNRETDIEFSLNKIKYNNNNNGKYLMEFWT